MLDRRHALLLLLRALPDVGYQPETATGKMLRRSTLPGPAPHHKGVCPTCDGVKRVQRPHDNPRPCARCRNDATKRERDGEFVPSPFAAHGCVRCESCKSSGKVPYDGYTNRPVTTDDSTVAARTDLEARERRDRDRRRVDQLLANPEPVSGDAVDALIAACDRRDREAPYRELVLALDELRVTHNLAYRKVLAVCVYGSERRQDLHPAVERRLDFGLRLLERRLPTRLRVPRDLVENDRLLREREQARFVGVRGKGDGQRASRDRELRRLHAEESIPVPQLMIRFGLSRSQVYAVLNAERGGSNGDTVAA